MPAVFAHYLRLLVVPWPLCADYSGYFDFAPGALGRHLGAFSMGALAIAALVVAVARRRFVIAFGLGWFLVGLLPVANIIPVPVPAAERFLYLPLAGIALAVAAAAGELTQRWPTSRRPLQVAGVAVGLAFVVLCNLRHRDWRDNDTLWAATARANPRSCGAQSAMGGTKLRDGLATHSSALLQEAVALEKRAIELCPAAADPVRGAMILTRLGAAHAVLGQLPPARQALDEAIRLAPRYALPVVWLGYVLFQSGDKPGAEASLRHAVIDLGPPDAAVAQVASQYMDKI
jgi:hypothetical protein